MEIGLSLGSNLGDRLACLQRARQALLKIEGVRLAAQSPVYETEPVDVQEAYRDMPYLNAVLILETARSAVMFPWPLPGRGRIAGAHSVFSHVARRLISGSRWCNSPHHPGEHEPLKWPFREPISRPGEPIPDRPKAVDARRPVLWIRKAAGRRRFWEASAVAESGSVM